MLLQNKYKNHQIILGSQSPRRKELLNGLHLDFEVLSLQVEESYPEFLEKQEVTEYLCAKKAAAYQHKSHRSILITADTLVWLDNQVLEKPKDANTAFEMLQKLSGQTHEVITSVGLFSKDKQVIFSDKTQVTFEKLNAEEIDYYIKTCQPFDKAGSYGIQEWIGLMGVSQIIGSYFTVMGLPVHLLYKELKEF
ncbi:MAG: Maf family nucleotide pyrophosphatase [Flavobacteriaceae bacterium]|nr:Maf family nucleotide pyrophosphatase [Flavobacteriaceae bacterium]